MERSGKEQEVSYETFEVLLFRTLAEKQLSKDNVIAVSGRIQANNYEKDESSYYNCNLIANSVYVLE